MSFKITRVNRFSKEYYLYPEEMKERELKYQEELKLAKELRLLEDKSKKARIVNLENANNGDIQEMLMTRGFDLQALPQNVEWMPINIFDNKKYELRTSQEWLELYKNDDGEPIDFCGKALTKSPIDGTYIWKPVRVTGYDSSKGMWEVEDDDGNRFAVFRVNLALNCENKEIFLYRFVEAYSERIFTDSFIRYNFYIDSMPIVDIRPVSQKFIDNILDLSRAYEFLRRREIIADNDLIKLINDFYCRTYNKVIFNNHLKNQKEIFTLKNQLIFQPNFFDYKEKKERGLIQMPCNHLTIESKTENVVFSATMSFQETFKLFCLNSALSKKRVVLILKEVEEINKDIFSKSLFPQVYPESVTLDTFRTLQETTVSKFMNQCKIHWQKRIIQSIEKNLKEETQGWFNLKNINYENYDIGKLKALLKMIDLKLADCLRSSIEVNYREFVRYLGSFFPKKVDLVSESEVINVYGEPVSKNEEPNTYPMIMLKAKIEDNKVTYSDSPDKFRKYILSLFESCLYELSRVSQVENQVAKMKMDKKPESYLSVPVLIKSLVDLESLNVKQIFKTYENPNKWLTILYEQLASELERVIEPVEAYSKFYESITQELTLNPSDFLVKFEGQRDKHSVQEILEELNNHKSNLQSLIKKFPKEIQVSCFKIDNQEIHSRLNDISNDIEKGLLKIIEDKGKDQLSETMKNLKNIKIKLKERPSNIEDLAQLEEYMKSGLNDELNKICESIDVARDIYDVLEERKVKVAPEDMKKLWYVISGPKEIFEAKKELQKEFETTKLSFFKEMNAEQLKFEVEIESMKSAVESFHKLSNLDDSDEIYAQAIEIHDKFQKMLERVTLYNNREILFGKKATNYEGFLSLEKEFRPLFAFWKIINTWHTQKNHWMDDNWAEVDAPGAEKFATESIQVTNATLSFLSQKNKKQFKKLIENAEKIKKEFEDFSQKVPILVALKNEGMTSRHWELISNKFGNDVNFNPESNPNFSFNYILGLGIMKHKKFCIEIGERAAREFEIEKNLKTMYDKWAKINVEPSPHKRADYFVVKSFDKIETELDEDFSMTNAMQLNPYKGPFVKQIDDWNDILLLMSNMIEEWRKFQAQWNYLQPIFDSPDISRQLPAESNMFKKIDLYYKQFLLKVTRIRNLLEICTEEGILDKILQNNEDLDKIQKELNNYLEVKRSKFARFYFISNDELLSILSETKEVENIQHHLRKVFENIGRLNFTERKQITAMISLESERVEFSQSINPLVKQVEDWMNEVEKQMKVSMKRELLKAVTNYRHQDKLHWIDEHPGQCVLNGWQVNWTFEVEEAIQQNSLSNYLHAMNESLMKVVKMNRAHLTPMKAIAIEALIVIEVHALEVIEKLIKENITDINSFEWISQLRYYMNDDSCVVKCIQTEFPYGYEYLGNTSRLVITPLTDKCYMTLMGALKLNLGGAPAGPAGTGKTETTKDLAKALAKQCVVFNCQESMDYLFLAKFFKGLASSGAWCCFDEFNRINIEVLSVIAQQLQELFRAKAERLKELRFEDTNIKIEPTFSVYITMNPGYAGRTELPDNLKALFRSVAMMVPDYALIAQIKLYSFGFTKARELARKMVDTFKLSSEQLSNQKHYDYGMRAVTSVINAAGLFKQQYSDHSHFSEEHLLYKALIDVNVPKFLSDDIPLFYNIVKDLFPELKVIEQRDQHLIDMISESCEEMNLQPDKGFIDKILQLNDTIKVRHGLMLVGPAGSGKTSNYKVLMSAINKLASANHAVRRVGVELINPKAMTLLELYGESKDLNWNEGVIEIVVERAIADSKDENRWVMFDGPVDAVWIESMNTVLDDNKKLCLASGKVLILSSTITMMFEVEDLKVASPATVSRCGMVYMDSSNVSLGSLIKSYVNSLPNEIVSKDNIGQRIIDLSEKYFMPSLKFYKNHKAESIYEISEFNAVKGFINLFNSSIGDIVRKPSNDWIELLSVTLEDLIIFCTMWSVGCLGTEKIREKFEEFMLKELSKSSSRSNILNNEYDFKSRAWRPWTSDFTNQEIPVGTPFHEIVIPTKDFARGLKLNNLLLSNQYHVLNPGGVGSGKTICTMRLFADRLSKEFNTTSMAFSARTTPKQIVDFVFTQIEKRRKGVFGPQNAKKCILFLDDINMPLKDEWGVQPPLELVRQYLDHSAWHVMKLGKEYIKIEDIIIVGSMVPPKAGRNDISGRVVRHFNVVPFTDFEDSTMNHIFEKMLSFSIGKGSTDALAQVSLLVKASVQVFNSIKTQLLPTPSKSHYVFNIRDLSKVIYGLTSFKDTGENVKQNLWLLWWHENLRAFTDRLSEEKDVQKVTSILKSTLLTSSGFHFDDICKSSHLIYSSLLNGQYEIVPEPQRLVDKVQDLLKKYNAEALPKNQMSLVMFLEACEYVSRISKVLQTPQGNVLLLGVGGSGRQSLSKLSVFASGLKTFQIEVGKGYNISKWMDDIKKLFMTAVMDNQPIAFILTDLQVINEQFLEDVNCLLNSGNIIGLPFTPDEAKKLDDLGKVECNKKGLQPNKLNILTAQINLLKKNLHIILAMSPVDQRFSHRIRMFPSLVNCCSLNWMHKWPEEALTGVSLKFLNTHLKDLDNKTQIANVFKDLHRFVDELSSKFFKETRRVNHLTPTSFLELLNIYKRIYVAKHAELMEQSARFENGVKKMFEANQQVEEIRISLREEEPRLKKAEIEVKELLENLEKDKASENQTKKIVALQESEAAKQQLEANALKKEAEESVRIANEELDRTLEKIQLLKPANIIEIRTAIAPVKKVKVVMTAICYLLLDSSVVPGLLKKTMTEDDFWPIAKNNLLNDPTRLFNLLISPETKDSIEIARIKKVAELVKKNTDIWTEKEMKNSSLANYYIYLWVECILNYTEINERTKPIRDKLEEVSKILEEKTSFLEQKKAELEASTKRLKALEDLYNEKTNFKEDLFRKIKECNIRLERASKLTTLLEDERKRWLLEIQNYGSKIAVDLHDSVIIAGKMAYFGPFTAPYRQMIDQFLVSAMQKSNLNCMPNLSLSSFLSSPVEILNWNIKGLPKDDTSLENGILMLRSSRWPLLIDPQQKANKFLKNLGKTLHFGLDVIKSSSLTLLRQLEQAIQVGKWVLLENISTNLDPILEPILQQKTFSVSGGKAISLGEKTIPYNENFRLFMTTTLPNPQFSPETFSKVTIINFCITKSGLEEHLLALIMMSENRELENKKVEIVVGNSSDRQKLQEIEDNILFALNESKGDVLMDESLILKLTDSKKTFTEINKRVIEATATEKEIDEIREKYRDCAFYASMLYFLISELVLIDPMYQYSLQWFEFLFGQSLEKALPNSDIAIRLVNIKDHFVYSLYERIGQSLYSQHKLIFSFMLTVRTLQEYGQLDPERYRYFLTGNTEEVKFNYKRVNFIPENAWPHLLKELTGINKLKGCEGILESFLTDPDSWRTYYESLNPHECGLPGNWDNDLDDFDKLLILKCFRLDKLTNGIQKYVSKKLGQKFVDYPICKLKEVFEYSNCTTPLIFMISSGSDPKSDFDDLVQAMEVKNVNAISLGQGQGDKAEKMIKEASKLNGDGGWVLLQNCHLAASWLPRLEMLCEELSPDLTHPNFRLWLTTMPFATFPATILQNSIKMTIEPPKGFRSNLKLTYTTMDAKIMESCTRKPNEFKKLLFGLAVFHAVVQERKKYGPIGWNIPYEFTQEDFVVCRRQLHNFLEDYELIPFKVLNFVFAEINYGGRVTDDKDIRLINALCKNFVNHNVLQDGHSFSPSNTYYSLVPGSQTDYLNYINSLPIEADPEIMGLHRNSEILTNQNTSATLVSVLRSIQISDGGSGNSDSERQVLDIIDIIESKIPPIFNLETLKQKFPVKYEESLNTVICQEAEKYNNLITLVKKSLENLRLCVRGFIVMNSELEKIYMELINYKVPSKWSDVFLSLKPVMSWIEELKQRVDFFKAWKENGTPNCFWLNAFCFPQAFITGTLQNYARKKKIAIDSLAFEFEILEFEGAKENLQKPEAGVYIYGIYIEGAKWCYDNKKLVDPQPKELYSKMPTIWFKPTEVKKEVQGKYLSPLYKTLTRSGTLTTTGHSSNFIMFVEIPTSESEEKWIKGGVACFLSLKD